MTVFDLDHLKRIVGNDPAFLRQVLQIFVRNTPQDMQALSESVATKNYEQIGFYSHKLKSAAGAIGYTQAYEDFKELEEHSKNQMPIAQIEERVNKLANECMSCMVDIKDVMNQL
ncbi:Hpt domain-containing protein [Flavobacteriales bacterium]|nr:Hpt domain-containing protein [Flavobacteriales bacterium]